MGLTFEPRLLATTLGSLPHVDVPGATSLVLRYTPDIPAWVQFPKLGESMMRQFNDGLPGLTESGGSQFVNTAGGDFGESLTDFYTYYLAVTEELEESALDAFAIPPEHARGLPELLRQVDAMAEPPLAIKGQVTGPFTLGTNMVDQDFRAIYYDERLRDVIVKLIGLKARWQVRQLRQVCSRVMIFLDEPALLGYGSATFISISREDVIRDLNEVAAAIHEEGALAGVHCEENTDFSLLMDSRLDFIDFDAWEHAPAIALYPESLTGFLERGGSLGWGLVPTLDKEAAGAVTVPELIEHFEWGLEQLARKGFPREPACAAGVAHAESVAPER